MSEPAAVLTPDLVRDEIHTWLGTSRFSVDWVSDTDMVLETMLGTALDSLGGTLLKPLTQMFATSQEYGLAITVGPDEAAPTFVRVSLTAGKRIVDQATVDATWWAGTTPEDATDSVLLRRAAAAATVCMIARRYKPYPVAMHGVRDPRVLFLLNEARRAKDATKRRKFLVKAARLEPNALAVRFAVLTDALRTKPTEQPAAQSDDDKEATKAAQNARLKAIRLALEQLVSECGDDRYLKVRALYNAGACAANSSDRSDSSEYAKGLTHFTALKTMLADKEWDKEPKKSYKADILPVVETALAVSQRQAPGAEKPAEDAVIAHASTARAMYNLACFFAIGADRPDRALAYLELAFEIEPGLAEFVETDHTLDEIRGMPAFKELVKKYPLPKPTKKTSGTKKAAGAKKAPAAKKAGTAKKAAKAKPMTSAR